MAAPVARREKTVDIMAVTDRMEGGKNNKIIRLLCAGCVFAVSDKALRGSQILISVNAVRKSPQNLANTAVLNLNGKNTIYE